MVNTVLLGFAGSDLQAKSSAMNRNVYKDEECMEVLWETRAKKQRSYEWTERLLMEGENESWW